MDCFFILFTVCTAPIFSYSAIFEAASVRINSLSNWRFFAQSGNFTPVLVEI